MKEDRFEGGRQAGSYEVSPSVTRDMGKCILCRRCVTACNEIQGVGVINAQNRGFKTVISPAMELPLADVNCTYCGNAPLYARWAHDGNGCYFRCLEALNDPKKYTVVQVAPPIRAAIGEEFDLPAGTLVTGKLVAALRELGFKKHF